MIKLGWKKDILGIEFEEVKIDTETLKPDKPKKFPNLKDGFNLVCGFERSALGQEMYQCKDMKDVEALYNAYAQGHATNIKWYQAPVERDGFMLTLKP